MWAYIHSYENKIAKPIDSSWSTIQIVSARATHSAERLRLGSISRQLYSCQSNYSVTIRSTRIEHYALDLGTVGGHFKNGQTSDWLLYRVQTCSVCRHIIPARDEDRVRTLAVDRLATRSLHNHAHIQDFESIEQ